MGILGHSLHNVDEQASPLIDQTMVLFGSGLGSSGFRHPGHLAFDEQHNEPLATLFVTMLKRVGIEADSFSSRTGALRELDA